MDKFGYDLNRDCNDIRPDYYFDVSCQGTVPEAIIAFLDSWDFESAIRLAVSLGGFSFFSSFFIITNLFNFKITFIEFFFMLIRFNRSNL